MSVLNQKTLKETIAIDGVGLHNGKKVHIEIKPAKPNTGILFKRTDIKKNNLVVPGVFNVSNAAYCTTISNDSGVTVSTIEHLMGALFGMGVDNALIEINNEEVTSEQCENDTFAKLKSAYVDMLQDTAFSLEDLNAISTVQSRQYNSMNYAKLDELK